MWKAMAQDDLDRMAKEGLRTLVVAMRHLDWEEYAQWKSEWDDANVAMEQREDRIARCCAAIERDLMLLGVTGVEDKLQEGVPETIQFFLDAGCVIWILTGDKRETAVNVAGASRLIDLQNDVVIHLDAGDDRALCKQQLDAALADSHKGEHTNHHQQTRITVVVDGHTLETIFEEYVEELTRLAKNIRSAVCCRLTPLQKAKIVQLFQQGNDTVCLSVGDGANDVSMIQEARVGIGIMGLEGSQAELASDYAIPKFRHLVRLCAVHGHFALYRNAFLIQFSFYKNNVVAFVEIFFSFFNGYTGQTIYDDWLLSVKNLLFTQLPPFMGGIFEKDVKESELESDPVLYAHARRHAGWDLWSASLWGASAITHAALVFFGCFPTLRQDDIGYSKTTGIWTGGNLLMTVTIGLVLGKALCHIRYWNGIMVGSILASVVLYLAFIFFYSSVFIPISMHFNGSAVEAFGDYKMYAYFVLWAVGFVLAVDFTFMFLQRTFKANYRDVVRLRVALRDTRLTRAKPPLVVAVAVGILLLTWLAVAVGLEGTS